MLQVVFRVFISFCFENVCHSSDWEEWPGWYLLNVLLLLVTEVKHFGLLCEKLELKLILIKYDAVWIGTMDNAASLQQGHEFVSQTQQLFCVLFVLPAYLCVGGWAFSKYCLLPQFINTHALRLALSCDWGSELCVGSTVQAVFPAFCLCELEIGYKVSKMINGWMMQS